MKCAVKHRINVKGTTMNEELIRIEDGKKTVEMLEDIFTEEFMRKYTRHESFESFKYSSMVFINWNADVLVYDGRLLDLFVKESTDFDNFEDMVKTATDIRYNVNND